MSGKPLDASWKGWVRENVARRCDPQELLAVLLEQQFSLDAIRECLRAELPAGALAASGGARKRLDESWKSWVAENLERHCDPQQMLGILLKNRFSLDSIKESLGRHFPPDAEWLEEALRPAAGNPDFSALAAPRLVRRADGEKIRKVETDRLQLYVLDEFLSDEQCDAVVALIGRQLRPSTVTLDSTDRYFRTSRTCDLSLLDSPLVRELDEQIARALGVRVAYTEGIQAQRYDVGQEFKAHTDFFEPGTDEYREHAAARGNRTWTFMVYLNDGMAGGGTRFVAIDRVFQPRKGRALAWNNLYPDGTPNYDTLHAGMPVEQGHKLVITKWFRERGAGPMFYED